jgi:hypothetical protein
LYLLAKQRACDYSSKSSATLTAGREQAKPLVAKIRGLLQNNKLGYAQKTVAEFEEALRPQLKKIQAAVEKMLKLENQFINQKRLT